MKYFWFACIPLLASVAVAQNNFVYTNDNVNSFNNTPANTVSAFKVAADGSLSLRPGSPFKTGGNGGGTNIDPEEIAITTRRNAAYLFAANDGSGTISVFRINPSTGELGRVTGSPFIADGPPGGDYSLAVSPDTKFLYATSDSTTVIHVYSIDSTGALTEIGSPYDTGSHNDGVKVTANGKFLVVGENSLNAVGVYVIGSSGTLTPVSGSPFPASGSPFTVTTDCASDKVFVSDNSSNDPWLIDVYSMARNGDLAEVPGDPFSNGTTSVSGGLVLSPDNKFLFVTDTFSNDISSLAVASDGALSQAPGSPFVTSNWPGGVAVTRSGNFVYSALFTVAEVDGRSVNAEGELAPVPGTPFSTGQSQTGVPTVITFPRPSCSAP
jgi:6-phosphogluconolactonase (cycloisomerase 2 family)